MQTQNKLFDDLARVANGAVSTLTGMKDEIDAMIRQRLERYLSNADLVTREEFDAVKAMAQKARTENEKLEARIAELESALAKPAKPARTKSAAKPAAKPKAGSRAKAAKKPAASPKK
ncbi:MAG: accessory factor UbiK family protein [Rhodospirillales bacterium]|nr:accessory factor UbiK family protein [Rhodospirillales bacterium]MBO6785421.1 accessory factor UbiK family protein [Rhodospirillales bacterium]